MLNLILTLVLLSIQAQPLEIHFGNGGGFTGLSHDFILDREGNLYKVNLFNEDRSLISKIDNEISEALFNKVNHSNLNKIKLNKPGNTYKYINLKYKTSSHKILWSGKSENNTLNLIYKELNALSKLKE